MVRRLIGIAIAGFCLLSLLVCLGTAWLWRRSETEQDTLELCRAHWYLRADSSQGTFAVDVIREWPGGDLARVNGAGALLTASEPGHREYRLFGAEASIGRIRVEALANEFAPWEDPDAPASRTPPPVVRWMPQVMPRWSVYWVPQWWVLTAAALPPLIWCSVHLRRAGIRRLRRRTSRCLHCGYDLRATPERCPECGAAAVAKREPIAPRPPAR